MLRGQKGVVLFSLGSIVDTKALPAQYMKNVLDNVAKFNEYYFIVKLSTNDTKTASTLSSLMMFMSLIGFLSLESWLIAA
ncbi:unnamed protein product [Bursaphelenchus okinawaensis]|uniref:Uncharacterized protein n=1 Tax=Bursaphelenchus okinawaensis TaxID=465554 RepID=A0A811L4F6_9BILA|nr:unnamed protein product [Bursaphelenchus okinawaensis]CAG9119454.1 unnamed protein product [Bursaphelenchus okinawaensis]